MSLRYFKRGVFIIMMIFFFFLGATVQAQTFRILPGDSEVRILLYKKGPLSALAHSHVLVLKEMKGRIQLQPEALNQSDWNVKADVNSIIVDPPEYRKLESGEFATEISENDIKTIRENMLSEKFLDAERFSQLVIQGVAVEGQLPTVQLKFKLVIRGFTKEFQAPFQIQITEEQLRATGQFRIKHTDFGITPFSILFGAIQIQDEILIKVDLRARKI